MNPFELITDDEVLYQMCQGWDTPTLLNMSETYKRVNEVCHAVIMDRHQKYIQKKIKDYETKLATGQAYFLKNFDKSYASIKLKPLHLPLSGKTHELILRVHGPNTTSQVNFPVDESDILFKSKWKIFAEITYTPQYGRKIAESLVKQNFVSSNYFEDQD